MLLAIGIFVVLLGMVAIGCLQDAEASAATHE